MEKKGKRGRPAALERAGREQRLLDVAQRLFAAHGYAGTSIALLAKEAQVATRSVYAWYGGKEQVLSALIAREARRHQDELDQLPPAASGESMLALARHLVRRSRSPWLRRLRAIADDLADPALSGELHEAGLGLFERHLRNSFAGPAPRLAAGLALAPELLADLFIGCVLGASPARPPLLFASPEIPVTGDALAQRIRLFANAIAPSPALTLTGVN